jgi:hypothetical protein
MKKHKIPQPLVFVMKQTAKVFLCYAKEDKPKVYELYQRLEDAGFEPWMDKVDLVGGEEWEPTIQKAIKNAHFFIACVSRHWVPTNPQDRKRFFRKEIQTALNVALLPPGDIFIIPIRLEECEVPDSLSLFHWVDYFKKDGWERLLRAIHTQLARLGLLKPLRSRPATLSYAQVSLMLREFDFFGNRMNPAARRIKHEHERRGEIVLDGATGLMWQQSGSQITMNFAGAENYIQLLNRERFAGYNDWHLPTLEEAMSLMEPEKENDDLYIDPIFDERQEWLWTADEESAGRAWYVYFINGSCLRSGSFVRAVRSGRSSL